MKNLIILSLFASILSLFSLEKVIIYADEGYPPYSYKKNGKMMGVYYDIFSEVFARIDGYDIEIKGVPWKRGLKHLAKGTGIALFPPYYLPVARPYINPYSEPVLKEEVVVFTREEIVMEHRQKWPEDFYGLKIGEDAGFSIGGKDFYQAVKEELIIREEARNIVSNIFKLARKRIDCYINDRLAVEWTVRNLKNEGRYVEKKHGKIRVGPIISSEYGYLGYSKFFKADWKQDFINKIDKEIKKMKEDGEIERILDRYR